MLSLNFSSSLFLVIYWAFLRLTLCTCFPFIWQSKYKEETSTTRPIPLDEPEVEVHSFSLFTFPYLCMHPLYFCVCSPFFLLWYPLFRSIPSLFSCTILWRDSLRCGCCCQGHGFCHYCCYPRSSCLGSSSSTYAVAAKEGTPAEGVIIGESAFFSTDIPTP